MSEAKHSVYCSFCGMSSTETPLMLAGPVHTAICTDCILAAGDQLVDGARSKGFLPTKMDVLHPRDSVSIEPASPLITRILGRATRAMTLAQLKFPAPNYTALKVAEEAGEVVKAAVHYAERRGEWSDVEDEAVQAIAMILRLLVEGDAVNGIRPPGPVVG